MGLQWMAWTWPTAAFFGFVVICLVSLTVWELKSPGGAPRRGVLGIDTTRGDRLFISMLGTAFIMLAWLAFLGSPLWGAVGVAVVYWIGVFRYV